MLGDFAPGQPVHADFATRASGAGATLTGGAVSVYKNGGTTQSTAGVTLTTDFDGEVGSHHVVIDTSADGAFYSAGAQFNIRLTAGTVNGLSAAGLPIDNFTLGLTAAADDAVLAAIAAGVPVSPSSVRTAVGLASANLDTQLDALPTNAELATALGTADDAVLAQVALVKAKTDNLPSDPADASDIAASHASLSTAIGTRASQTSVDDLPTNAELATALGTADDAVLAAIAALNNLSAAQVKTQADQAIVDAALATAALLATAQTAITAIKAKTDSLTFTQAGSVDANVQRVNDVNLQGNGQVATPWGPA